MTEHDESPEAAELANLRAWRTEIDVLARNLRADRERFEQEENQRQRRARWFLIPLVIGGPLTGYGIGGAMEDNLATGLMISAGLTLIMVGVWGPPVLVIQHFRRKTASPVPESGTGLDATHPPEES